MSLRPLTILAIVGVTGCVQSPTVPKIASQDITMRIRSSAASIALGQTDTITVTVTNHLTEPLRLVFETSCQILAYVRTQSARVVVPPSGTHDCVKVPSQLSIPSEGSVTREFLWKGMGAFEPPGSATPLPAGDYFVTAEMTVGSFRASAGGVKVTLLP
jgi:hypothetical protein